MIAYAIFMIAMGFYSIIFGVMSIGNPLIMYLLAIIVVIVLTIGVYAYAISLARGSIIMPIDPFNSYKL